MSRRAYSGQNRTEIPSAYQQLAWVASDQGKAAFLLSPSFNSSSYQIGFEITLHIDDDTQDQYPMGYYWYEELPVPPFEVSQIWRLRKVPSNASSNANKLLLEFSYNNTYDLAYNNKQYWNTIKLYNKTLTRADGTTTTVANVGFTDSNARIGMGAEQDGSVGGSNFVIPPSTKICYIKNLKVWRGTTQRHDLIPCLRRSDKKVGFYCLTTSTFYTTETNNEFIAGPSV